MVYSEIRVNIGGIILDNFDTKVHGDDSNGIRDNYVLNDSYKGDYDCINNYYTAIYGKGKYIKMALNQIEEEFKRAQAEGISLASVTGGNARCYADTMRKKMVDRDKVYGKLWSASIVLLMLLILTLLRTFRSEYDSYNLYDRLNHMYIGVIEIFLLPMAFLLMFVIGKIAAMLFYRPTLMKGIIYPIRYFFYFIFIIYAPKLDKIPLSDFCRKYFGISLPVYLFIVAGLLLIMVVSNRKSKKERNTI